MSEIVNLFLVVFIATQVASMFLLSLGARHLNNPHLIKIGKAAYKKKMKALDTMWPLTKIRPNIEAGNETACLVILSSLIALKSFVSFLFGIIMVVWLPLASIMTPAIIYVHDQDDPGLQPWVKKVATLQVTSHALAAALGATLFYLSYQKNGFDLGALWEEILSHGELVVLALGLSLVFAVLAGKEEASGIMKRGV